MGSKSLFGTFPISDTECLFAHAETGIVIIDELTHGFVELSIVQSFPPCRL